MENYIDVEIENVTKRFGGVTAVSNLSLKVKKGEFLALLGPSGCGKTTTLRMIAGLTEVDEGLIRIRNQVVNDIPVHERNIGFVFQSYALFPHMNVFDNISFGLKMRGFSDKAEISKRAEEVLSLIQLPDIGSRFPGELSGGQQQRVALARSIIIKPMILLLDEPLSNLDAKLRERMRVELKQIQNKLDITTIFVTHDQIEALVMADRVAIMNAGKIEQIGKPEEIYNSPETEFIANFVGKSNFVRGRIVGVTQKEAKVVTWEGLNIIISNLGFSVGQEVNLAIRPEKIRIMERGQDGFLINSCSGRIEFTAFLGSIAQYQVLSEEGHRFIIEQQINEAVTLREKGEKICLGWSPKDCLVLIG